MPRSLDKLRPRRSLSTVEAPDQLGPVHRDVGKAPKMGMSMYSGAVRCPDSLDFGHVIAPANDLSLSPSTGSGADSSSRNRLGIIS